MRSKIPFHQRFYFPPRSINDDTVVFSDEESKHMLASLRLSKGDVVSATDGEGKIYSVAIEDTSRGLVTGRIRSVLQVAAPAPGICLFQGVIKPARMDTIVEQCIELGIAGLIPVGFERSRGSVSMSRLVRWRRIATETMKQSLRSHLADIHSPEAFDGAIGLLGQHDLIMVASETDTGPISGVLASAAKPVSIALWVGPEGGLTDRESEVLAEAGALFFSLGPHRLRSETAAAAAVALVAEHFRR